jgi:surfeit locus 1 family protein
VTGGSRRRIALLVVAVVVAAVCVRLGFWQLDRLEQRRATNARVRSGLEGDVAPFPELLRGTADPQDLAWRRTAVEGTYDPDREVILYGRTQHGRPGDHVLTPLRLADGSAVIVDRGWIPFEADRDPPVVGPAAAPNGVVTVEGVVLAAEDDSSTLPSPNGEDPVTTLQRLDLGRFQRQVPYDLAPVAIQLQVQRPAQPTGLPEPATLPDLDEGPHLGYAIQWFAFASIAIVGYGLLANRDRRDRSRQPGGGGRG